MAAPVPALPLPTLLPITAPAMAPMAAPPTALRSVLPVAVQAPRPSRPTPARVIRILFIRRSLRIRPLSVTLNPAPQRAASGQVPPSGTAVGANRCVAATYPPFEDAMSTLRPDPDAPLVDAAPSAAGNAAYNERAVRETAAEHDRQVREAYDKGRRDERASRRSHPFLALAGWILAAVGAVVLA